MRLILSLAQSAMMRCHFVKHTVNEKTHFLVPGSQSKDRKQKEPRLVSRTSEWRKPSTNSSSTFFQTEKKSDFKEATSSTVASPSKPAYHPHTYPPFLCPTSLLLPNGLKRKTFLCLTVFVWQIMFSFFESPPLHRKTFFLVFVGRCGVSSESWWSGLRPRNPAECCWWLFCAIVLLPASVPALHKAQFCRGLSLDIRQPTNHTNSLCDLDLWGLFWRPRNILVIWILLWQKCDIPTHALFLSKIQTC